MDADSPGYLLLQAIRALEPEIVARSQEIEDAGQLPMDLVQKLTEIGCWDIVLPREYGGLELPLADSLEIIEELSRIDGSVGWNVAIGVSSGTMSTLFAPETAKTIWTGPRTVRYAGVFAFSGKAVAVDGGYRVGGRWTFASGCNQATHLTFGCAIFDGGEPRLDERGNPAMVTVLVPASEVEIVDTWHVSGLKGTGSADCVLEDLFVPAERTFSRLGGKVYLSQPMYHFPNFSYLSLKQAAVALGLARRAIDELVVLAGAKTPMLQRRTVASQQVTQRDVAQAEAAWGASRAFIYQTFNNAWETQCRGEKVSVEQRIAIRLACSFASDSALRIVDSMYSLGGATSIYESSALQRCFRDMHVTSQHILLGPSSWEVPGRLLLGIPTETTTL